MTIGSKILGPILDYRAAQTVRSYAASSTTRSASCASPAANQLLFSAINCFIGLLRRPTDILRMQSIFHFLVETVTPPL